jgi:hypothetical protein
MYAGPHGRALRTWRAELPGAGYTHPSELGLCSWDECGGHLVDGTCISCGYRHGIRELSRFHGQRLAAGGVVWGPVREAGRCAHADAVRAGERRELERQAWWRWTAEELGDPQK